MVTIDKMFDFVARSVPKYVQNEFETIKFKNQKISVFFLFFYAGQSVLYRIQRASFAF